jgi:hypothetical protein
MSLDVRYTPEPIEKIKEMLSNLYSVDYNIIEQGILPDDTYMVDDNNHIILVPRMSKFIFGIWGLTGQSIKWVCDYEIRRINKMIDNYDSYTIKFSPEVKSLKQWQHLG